MAAVFPASTVVAPLGPVTARPQRAGAVMYQTTVTEWVVSSWRNGPRVRVAAAARWVVSSTARPTINVVQRLRRGLACDTSPAAAFRATISARVRGGFLARHTTRPAAWRSLGRGRVAGVGVAIPQRNKQDVCHRASGLCRRREGETLAQTAVRCTTARRCNACGGSCARPSVEEPHAQDLRSAYITFAARAGQPFETFRRLTNPGPAHRDWTPGKGS